MQLSPHFSLSEFTKSQTAIRKGIDKTQKGAPLEALKALCVNVLEPVREHFGKPIKISSGYRCKALNDSIGGSGTSQHCAGEAADFEVPGVSNKEVAKYIRDNLTYDQLILEGYDGQDPNSGWIHVSYRPDRARKMHGTWNKAQGYKWGTLG